jgi:hypothetical protein
MKCESGAIGRALASLGMLTLPSSGIASADDMADYVKSTEGPAMNETTAEETKARRAPNPKGGS